jgi:hypothetical protein
MIMTTILLQNALVFRRLEHRRRGSARPETSIAEVDGKLVCIAVPSDRGVSGAAVS